jgi:tetratricopeptide (TPR) repeat protein
MERKFGLVLILFLSLSAALTSQEILVEYVEGVVDLRSGSEWQEVFIGDTIPADATLRIGATGMVELRGADKTYLLAQPGTFQLASIIAASNRHEQVGAGALARQRLRAFSTNDTASDAVVAGVRASEAVDRNAVTWAGGASVPELIETGIAELVDGNYEDAYYSFFDAWEFAGSDELPMAQFYLGYAAYLTGYTGEALGLLRSPEPDPTTEYYDDHLLTLGQVLIDGFAYEDAAELLAGYLEHDDIASSDRQTAHLLAGLAYDGLGEATEATAHLQQAAEIDPDSEIAALVRTILQEM